MTTSKKCAKCEELKKEIEKLKQGVCLSRNAVIDCADCEKEIFVMDGDVYCADCAENKAGEIRTADSENDNAIDWWKEREGL